MLAFLGDKLIRGLGILVLVTGLVFFFYGRGHHNGAIQEKQYYEALIGQYQAENARNLQAALAVEQQRSRAAQERVAALDAINRDYAVQLRQQAARSGYYASLPKGDCAKTAARLSASLARGRYLVARLREALEYSEAAR